MAMLDYVRLYMLVQVGGIYVSTLLRLCKDM
jgi:hypothetical protein